MRLKLRFNDKLRAAIYEGETIPVMKSQHILIDEHCIIGVVDISKCDNADPPLTRAGTLETFKMVKSNGSEYLQEYNATTEEILQLTHAMVESFNHLRTKHAYSE